MLNVPNHAPRLSPADISGHLARDEMILLDVRELAEVKASGKAKGAKVIPMALLPLKADPSSPDCVLDLAKPVAVYCAAGGRATMAAQLLARLGYGPVHMIGGLGDWAAAGGQIEPL